MAVPEANNVRTHATIKTVRTDSNFVIVKLRAVLAVANFAAMLNQFAGLTISQWISCRRHCNTLRMITKFFRVFPASNSQKMFKKYILQTTDFLHQESILQLSQLFKSEIAVFENKVLLGSESISLHYVNPGITLDQIKDTV